MANSEIKPCVITHIGPHIVGRAVFQKTDVSYHEPSFEYFRDGKPVVLKNGAICDGKATWDFVEFGAVARDCKLSEGPAELEMKYSKLALGIVPTRIISQACLGCIHLGNDCETGSTLI